MGRLDEEGAAHARGESREGAEREHAATISLLRTTLDATADGILVSDTAGRVVLYNERFRQMWSLPQSILDLQIDERAIAYVENQLVDPRTFRARIDELYGAPELESTDSLVFRDGRTVERYSRPQRMGEQVIGRVWSFRDVTARRRAERALEIAVQMRDEFIGIASHELFTPITSLAVAIRGLAGAFGAAPSSPGGRLLQAAERQVVRLTRLVQELLDVTRIDGGRMELDLAMVDLGDVARDVVERFAPELDRDRITTTLFAPAPVVGLWDRSRLEQVATNLLANAIKFGQGKPIALSVRATHGGAELAVRDQGIGIPPDRQAQIFERFQRAVSSQHYAGLGLGLFIARQIVEAHGGHLGLQSSLGQGTAFTVELPLVRPQEDA